MAEVSKELVPMSDGRAGFDALKGRESRPYDDYLSAPEVDLINRHVRIILLPGLHTEDWGPIRRVDRAIGRVGRIARTTLIVEAVGYKQAEEAGDAKNLADPTYARQTRRGATGVAAHIRTAARVGHKLPYDMDAFIFGIVLALSQGMPVVHMDFDEVEDQRWLDLQKHMEAPRLALINRQLDADFVNTTIRDACQRVEALRLLRGNKMREKQRERTAVGRVLHEALNQALQEETNAKPGYRTLLVLFGAGHLKGYRERLNRLGVNYVVESLVNAEEQARGDAYFLPRPLEQQERQCVAAILAAQIFGIRAEQFVEVGTQIVQLDLVTELLDQLSDQEVRDVYEEYRQFRLKVRKLCTPLGPMGRVIERTAQGVYANKAARLLLNKVAATRS